MLFLSPEGARRKKNDRPDKNFPCPDGLAYTYIQFPRLRKRCSEGDRPVFRRKIFPKYFSS